MTPDTRHILTLDAIRGIAAIAVLLIHIGWARGDQSFARFGYLAVDLFFVISGFVIGRAYEERLAAGMSWRRFMLLRIARLYPSLFLGALLGVVAYFVVPAGTYELGWYSAGHFFLVPDLQAPQGIFPLNGVLWSLFFELVINAVHALFLRRMSNVSLSVFVLAMGAVWAWAASTGGNWGGGWHYDTFAGGFARVGWGYGAGVLLHRVTRHRHRIPAIVPIVLAALVLLVPSFTTPRPRIVTSVFLLFPLIVFLAVGSEVPSGGRRFARWLGATSYPLYAIHHPLLMMIVTRFDSGGHFGWVVIAGAIITIATIVEFAWDRPLRKLLARYVDGMDGTKPAGTSG